MNYKNYQIALSPELGLTPEEFATAWNANPECQAVSEAKLSHEKSGTFEPITLTVILITVGTGVAANLISDLIKGLVQNVHNKKQQQTSHQQNLPPAQFHKRLYIEETKKPDGTYNLIVDAEEE